MFTNQLKLNPDKTKFILIYSPKNCKQLSHSLPLIFCSGISGLISTKCQEPWSDIGLQFQFLKPQVIKSTRVHARDLYRIHHLLDLNTLVLLANALVSSGLDYCNSLFLLLTDFELRRLQLVQNSLCRVVSCHPFL